MSSSSISQRSTTESRPVEPCPTAPRSPRLSTDRPATPSSYPPLPLSASKTPAATPSHPESPEVHARHSRISLLRSLASPNLPSAVPAPLLSSAAMPTPIPDIHAQHNRAIVSTPPHRCGASDLRHHREVSPVLRCRRRRRSVVKTSAEALPAWAQVRVRAWRNRVSHLPATPFVAGARTSSSHASLPAWPQPETHRPHPDKFVASRICSGPLQTSSAAVCRRRIGRNVLPLSLDVAVQRGTTEPARRDPPRLPSSASASQHSSAATLFPDAHVPDRHDARCFRGLDTATPATVFDQGAAPLVLNESTRVATRQSVTSLPHWPFLASSHRRALKAPVPGATRGGRHLRGADWAARHPRPVTRPTASPSRVSSASTSPPACLYYRGPKRLPIALASTDRLSYVRTVPKASGRQPTAPRPLHVGLATPTDHSHVSRRNAARPCAARLRPLQLLVRVRVSLRTSRPVQRMPATAPSLSSAGAATARLSSRRSAPDQQNLTHRKPMTRARPLGTTTSSSGRGGPIGPCRRSSTAPQPGRLPEPRPGTPGQSRQTSAESGAHQRSSCRRTHGSPTTRGPTPLGFPAVPGLPPIRRARSRAARRAMIFVRRTCSSAAQLPQAKPIPIRCNGLALPPRAAEPSFTSRTPFGP